MGKATAVRVRWVEGHQVIVQDDRGHAIVVDSPTSPGGETSGISPARLLMAALGACIAVNTVAILNKQRQRLHRVTAEVDGIQDAEDIGHPLRHVRVSLRIEGEDLDEAKVERAVALAENKYCTISRTLREPPRIITTHSLSRSRTPGR